MEVAEVAAARAAAAAAVTGVVVMGEKAAVDVGVTVVVEEAGWEMVAVAVSSGAEAGAMG